MASIILTGKKKTIPSRCMAYIPSPQTIDDELWEFIPNLTLAEGAVNFEERGTGVRCLASGTYILTATMSSMARYLTAAYVTINGVDKYRLTVNYSGLSSQNNRSAVAFYSGRITLKKNDIIALAAGVSESASNYAIGSCTLCLEEVVE